MAGEGDFEVGLEGDFECPVLGQLMQTQAFRPVERIAAAIVIYIVASS